MVSVGHEGGRTDVAADPDAVPGHELVAREADDAGHQDRGDVGHHLRVDEPVDGLPAGDERREGDHDQHEEPREVLRASVAEGVAPGGRPRADDEGDPQRDGRQGIAEVVDGIGEERYRAREDDHHELEGRRDPERDERELERADAPFVARQRLVERVARVMAVSDEAVEEAEHAPTVGMRMGVVMVVGVVVRMHVVVVRHGVDLRVACIRARAVHALHLGALTKT